MEYTIAPPQLKFQSILDSVRKNHPYAEEIAWMDMRDEVRELLAQIDSLEENRLDTYAYILGSSRMELVFHALLQNINKDQKDKLLAILSIRSKRRFFYYNWIMLQEHYTSKNLIESFCILISFMQENYPAEFSRSLASRIPFPGGDWISQALAVLESENCALDEFISKYGIMKNSAFAKALHEEFFLHCSIDGFIRNEKAFMEWIRLSEEIQYPQIKHYLDVMTVLEYSENINNFLIDLYGPPGHGVFWDNIDEIFRSKLSEWRKLKDLGRYMGIQSEKFLFWKNYYQYVEKVECYPELGILFMYLPGHVVVDFKKDIKKSYLYKKAKFQLSLKSFGAQGGFEGKCAWPMDTDSVIPVKSVILENHHSEIYELDYERLGKLYIRDYLEMYL
ncbi:MAG TPA: hypothetical protein GX505_07505 [Clostridiales bacterium]|nr:hypothetical protein [Clostridiales bacterium]